MSSAASASVLPSRSSASCTGAAGAVNHRPGSPATWMPMSVPLRVIRTTTLEPADARAASDAHFAAAIVRFRKKWWLPAMNRAARSPPSAANPAQQVAHQQVAGGLAAHVQLVAHLQALRGQREHVDRALALEQPGERRTELVAEEPQPLDRLVVADAEPQRPPGPLVQRRVRPRAGRLVARPPTPASTASRLRSSARRGRARCRVKRDLPRRQQPRRLFPVARPALEQARGDHRPALGSQTRPNSIAVPECSSVRPCSTASTSPAGATATAAGLVALDPLDGLVVGRARRARRDGPTGARARARYPGRRRPAGATPPRPARCPGTRSASANRSSPTLTAATRVSTSVRNARAICYPSRPPMTSVQSSPRRSATRPRCKPSASSRSSARLAAAIDGDDAARDPVRRRVPDRVRRGDRRRRSCRPTRTPRARRR